MPLKEVAGLILAGGQSSRLFPFNKVLSDMTGSGKTLLQQARARLKHFPAGRIFALTTRDMAASVKQQIKLPARQILVDPVRRGTWPAILWAMAHLRRHGPGTVMAVLTGDHLIQDEKAFQQSLRSAIELARLSPAIVMMGIPPRGDPREWCGFGCFQVDAGGHVVQFQEKPTLEEARRMGGEGGWLWNSGMFFFRISTAEEALRRLQPGMYSVYDAMSNAIMAGKKEEASRIFGDFPEKIPHPLDPSRSVDNSIDYAIMTLLVKRPSADLSAQAVHGVHFRWTDLGQWDALRSVVKPDSRGNFRVGKTVLKGDVRDCILVAQEGHTIEADGVRGLIVAFANRTALVVATPHLAQVKEAAHAAIRHADRVLMEHNVTGSEFRVSRGRVIAVGLSGISLELTGARLVVSTKRSFIR